MNLRERLAAAVAQTHLPEPALATLAKLFKSGSCISVIPRAEAGEIAKNAGIDETQLMLRLLPVVKQFAVAPISNFQVGAIARGKSGKLYFGANMEFTGTALSLSTHAEQAAMVNAWVHGETGLDRLAVNYAPCGYCRQFLYELVTSRNLEVFLPHTPPALLTHLLPHAFGPRDLNVQGGLMEERADDLELDHPSKDPAILVALSAARMSYAPYSHGHAGMALATRGGQIFTGPYAENAAYNPSMSPLEAALAHLNLCGATYEEIVRAVLVQARGSLASQVEVSELVLKTVSKVKLEVVYAHRKSQRSS
ncbi:MAG TPA: cytidine deaminase [Terriglobia bacterium]|nr:cytidine deaminase [Terriglobia bacterium]